MPTASATILGGVKVGAGLSINNGVLSANGGGTADSVDWSGIQNVPSNLVYDDGYVHTDNNYTTAEKTKLSGIAAGAQVNVIESIKVDGTALTIMDKAVNIDLSAKADLVDGKIPSNQLPSYVDDVIEAAQLSAFPTTGESGKIYVAQDTGTIYRWSGSTYVSVSNPLDIATTEEATAGTNDTKAMTPAKVKSAINAQMSGAVKATAGTFESTVTTKSFTADGIITNVMVYDSVSGEQVIVDIAFSNSGKTITLTTASEPTNALTVVYSYVGV